MLRRLGNLDPLFWAMAATLVVGLGMGLYRIDVPGLYYDEALFGNAALGCPSAGFVNLKVHGVPVLLMDYIGALKAWIYYPIFAYLPVDLLSIRAPALLMGLLGAVLMAGAIGMLFGRRAHLAALPLIVLEPSLLMHSRLDWGPDALMFLFRGALLYALASWIVTERVRWLWLGCLAMVLGSFDKLNFLWIEVAAVIAFVSCFGSRLKFRFRERRGAYVSVAVAFLLVIGLTGLRAYELGSTMKTDSLGWAGRLAQAGFLARLCLAGGGALNFVVGDGLRFERYLAFLYVVGVALAIICLLRGGTRRPWRRVAFVLVFSLVLAAAFAATKAATGPHHSAVLSGLLQALLGAMIFGREAEERPQLGAKHSFPRLFEVSWVLLLTCVQMWVFGASLSAMQHPQNRNWDQANTRLADFAKAHKGAHFICTDWGMGNQIIMLAGGDVTVDDQWPGLLHQDEVLARLRSLPRNVPIFLVLRTSAFANVKGGRECILRALVEARIPSTQECVLYAWDGMPLIEVIKITSSREQ